MTRSILSHLRRTFRRGGGLAALAVVTLAVGIGANTAIFSVVHAVLLKPLPYPDSERLVQVWNTGEARRCKSGETQATRHGWWRVAQLTEGRIHPPSAWPLAAGGG
jgi:hypothetical protein